MNILADRYLAVKEQITQACLDAGREPSTVRLLPVSKTHDAPVLRQAYELGMSEFGENRVQEITAKSNQLADLAIRWVLIGPLQANKVRKAAQLADEFQALESLKIAEALDRRLAEFAKSMDVLIEVNTSGEDSKHGIAPGQVVEFANQIQQFNQLIPRGLMTVAIPSDDESKIAACFEKMLDLQDQLRHQIPELAWNELSMGMSKDFRLAIKYGATTLRIGTAIFGQRYS